MSTTPSHRRSSHPSERSRPRLRNVLLQGALVIALLLSACGGRATEPPAPTTAAEPSSAPAATAEVETAGAASAPDPTQPPVEEENTTAPTAPEPATAEEVYGQLSAAADAGQAQAALQVMYAQLGVGLYTADGAQILPGAEQGPDDFYLYEFESELLARAYAGGDRFPVDRLARFIGEAGYGDLDTQAPLTPDEYMAMLGDAVLRARSDPSAFSYRLVDALGQSHEPPLDLTAPGLDPAATHLDAVQLFLVLYDILGDGSEPVAISSGPRLARMALPSQTSPCQFRGIPDIVRKAGFFAAGKLRRFGSYVNIASQALDSLHDALVMLGYTVTLDPKSASTHWKHEPNEPNREVTFTAHVDFDLGKLNNLASCGKMVGFSFPEQGAAKDVAVEWEIDPTIEWQGAWKQSANTYKTDSSGDATLTFSPKIEARPGDGLNKTDHGWIMARIMTRSVTNPRKVFDLLGVGPEFHLAEAGLEVARHVNLTMTIGGKFTSADGMITMVFPATEIPLTVGSTQITGGGQMAVKFEVNGLPPGCTFDAGIPLTLSVTGVGMDPIQFTVDGLAQMNLKARCEMAGQAVDLSMPVQSPTTGQPVKFSLSPKDGEKYSYKAEGMTGSLDFTLSEK